MKKKTVFIKYILFMLLISIITIGNTKKGNVTIARLKYGGGGDWYSDPSSLPNLLQYINDNTPMTVQLKESRVSPTDNNFFNYPYLYMTGHGNIKFNEQEVEALRKYLTTGGFLHVDDNYGLDKSFRRELKKIFPNHDLVELPLDHEIYHCFYKFPNGLPKIHEHDNKPAQGFGLFYKERLVIFYSYESDLGDGWESPNVHKDPADKRTAALKMGTNIIIYSLTH